MKERDTIYHGGGSERRRKRDDIHETPDISYITNPDVEHEHTDVSVRPIAWFVFGLGAFGAVVCVLMLLMFNLLEKRAESNELPTSPLARTEEEKLPPEPRLQAAPGFGVTPPGEERKNLELQRPQSEYEELRRAWNNQLNNYGAADPNTGLTRIPIDQAKQLYLARQAQPPPANAAPPPSSSSSSSDGQPTIEMMPMPSSSGRTLEKRNQ